MCPRFRGLDNGFSTKNQSPLVIIPHDGKIAFSL